MNRLEIEHLSKSYQRNRRPALADFNYSFSDGIYGLLGPNGAGKSTLMNMIVGNLQPDSGSIRYEGQEILSLGRMYRKVIGFMPQQQQLYEQFTVKRFLFYFAALKNLDQGTAVRRITELLRLVNLSDVAGKRLNTLSGGMKQRVLFCVALLADPKVLILDEPTAGLDPKERMNIRNYLSEIASDKTIILATHVISDIEQIAKETIFLRAGETVLSGRPEEVIREVSGHIWEVEIEKEAYSSLNAAWPRNRITGEKDGRVSVKVISESMPELSGVMPAMTNLEDVYMYLYP